MNDYFEILNKHLINKGSKKEYEEIIAQAKKDNIDIKEITKKCLGYVKDLISKAQNLGFNTDFESFSQMLEEYILKKEKMSNEEKKLYLEVLIPLSKAYDINLKEELEYSSKKNSDFQKLCQEDLIKKDKVEGNNKASKLKEAVRKYLEELKQDAKKINYYPSKENYYKILEEYLDLKSELDDAKKADYLRVLVKLSTIYKLDLRSALTNKRIEEETPLMIFFSQLSNPLKNNKFLKQMLYQRYTNCSFNISELTDKPRSFSNFDSSVIQKQLILKIISLINDKKIPLKLKEEYQKLLEDDSLKNISIEVLEDKLNSKEDGTINVFIKELYNSTKFDTMIENEEHAIFAFSPLQEKNTFCFHINSENKEETYIFLSEYITKCLLHGLSYEMIGFQNDELINNNTILFANDEDLLEKVNILEEIESEHPNLVKSFGSPIEYAAKLPKSYFAISHTGLETIKNTSYNYDEYLNNIAELSYYRAIAKIITNNLKIPQDKEKIDNFISLNNFHNSGDNPLNSTWGEIEFIEIKDIINKNIPNIINTINLYFDEEEHFKSLLTEFKNSCLYFSNLIQGKDKKAKTNIALNYKNIK